MKLRAFLCFEFLTTKIIKHLTIWLGWLGWLTLQRREHYQNHNFNYFRSTVLELLLHPELSTQKGNKFCKIGSSTKFYVKNSSDITKRRSSWDKQEDKRIHDWKLKQKNLIFCRFIYLYKCEGSFLFFL